MKNSKTYRIYFTPKEVQYADSIGEARAKAWSYLMIRSNDSNEIRVSEIGYWGYEFPMGKLIHNGNTVLWKAHGNGKIYVVNRKGSISKLN